MRTISDRKLAAKTNLGNGIFTPNWMSGVLVNLIMWGVSAALGSISVGALTMLVLGPLSCGVHACYLKNARDKEQIQVEYMFAGFKVDFGGTFLLGLLMDIFVALWSILFVIPGIIKAYSYSMAYFIKADHPEYGWRQCIDESRKLMNGHKWELFVQDLSFIGWIIVGSICLGVGFLWVDAYQNAAKAEFYKDLIREERASTVGVDVEFEVNE
ncbi:MAG: DUF975 family protein [Bacillota bacterium]|nr:DUF975 family protein [Bacillota bacterium]